MTITQAIQHATANVEMVKSAPKGYSIYEYIEDRNVWIMSHPMPYAVARETMTEKRHVSALVALGWDEYDAETEAMLCTGTLRDRVKASVA